MDLGQFVNDTESMLNGVWVPFMGDAKILVAKFNNPNYTAFIQGNRISESDLETEGGISDELADLMCRAIAETVLLGWENITINEEPVEYSKETAYRILKRFEAFRNQVIAISSQQKHFADEEFEEALNKIGPF